MTVGTSTIVDSSSRIGRADVQAARQPDGHLLPAGGAGAVPRDFMPLHPQPAAQQPQRQKRHAGQPRQEHERSQWRRCASRAVEAATADFVPAAATGGRRCVLARRQPAVRLVRRGSVIRTAAMRAVVHRSSLRHVCTRGDRRHRQHQRQADGRDHVADVGGAAPKRAERARSEQRRRARPARRTAAAPSRSPARPAAEAGAQSRSSRTSHLVAARSSISLPLDHAANLRELVGEARLLASACITSFDAEPPNARSSRSRTSCRCVCSSVSRGW